MFGKWTESPVGLALLSACVLGLSAAWFDFVLTVAFQPQVLTLVPDPLLPPLTTALFLIVLHLPIWAVGLVILRPWFKPDARALAVGLTLALGVYFVLVLLHYGLRVPLWLDGKPVTTAQAAWRDVRNFTTVMLPLATAIALVTAWIVRRWTSPGSRSAGPLAPTLAVLSAAAETGAFVASAGAGWMAPGRLLAWVAVVAVTLLVWRRLARTLRPAGLVAAYAVNVSVCVVLLSLAWRAARPAEPDAGHSDRRIRRVILLTVDTLRQDALSCYGGRAATGNFDRLAADGVRFAEAYAPSGWTLPSFASILTGLSPFVHGVQSRESRLPDAFVTLAERARDAGYRTAAIGTNPFLGPMSHLDQGFASYDFFPKYLPTAVSFGSVMLWRVRGDDGSAGNLTRRAVDWVRRNRERDFLLWVHYLDPHAPYAPQPEFRPAGPPPPGMGPQFDGFASARTGHFVPDAGQRAWVRALYEGDVRYVDQQVGRLLAALDEMGLYDETLIVFASDHGEEQWDHASFEHGHTLYDELLRVPLVIKLPVSLATGRRGGTVEQRVCVGSVTPTVLELCGLDLAAEREPRSYPSLAPLCGAAGQAPAVEPLGATGLLYFENREAVIFDEFKYIRTVVAGREELYDLRTDPGEQRSLVLLRPEILERGRHVLEQTKTQAERLKAHYGVRVPETVTLDAATIRGLKALGYVQ